MNLLAQIRPRLYPAMMAASVCLTSHAQVESIEFITDGQIEWTDQSPSPLNIAKWGQLQIRADIQSNQMLSGSYVVSPMEFAYRFSDQNLNSILWGEDEEEWFLESSSSVILRSFDAQTGIAAVTFSVPVGGLLEETTVLPEFVFAQNTVELAVAWAGSLSLDPVSGIPAGQFEDLTASIPGAISTGYVRHLSPPQDLAVHNSTEFGCQFLESYAVDTEYSIEAIPAGSALLPGQVLQDN